MRLIVKTSSNKGLIPFNYQPQLTSVLHRWLGENNEEHGKHSLYSFSWLNNIKVGNKGFHTTRNTSWFINFHDNEKIKTLVKGIQADPNIFCGMQVEEIILQENPTFLLDKVRFNVSNPIFIRCLRDKGNAQYLYYNDSNADEMLTSSLKRKLVKAGLDDTGVKVSFDKNYSNAKTKGFEYKGIFNKGSICPIIIEGTAEQLQFAWNVGIGSSTGIGFGALV